MFFENIHFMKCLISPYIGSCLQSNGLIWLPQVWGYLFYPMGSSLKGKGERAGRPFSCCCKTIFQLNASHLNFSFKFYFLISFLDNSIIEIIGVVLCIILWQLEQTIARSDNLVIMIPSDLCNGIK